MAKEAKSVNIVIVGAGASGLCAAQRLSAHDPSLSIAILEAEEERIGGRIHTVRLNDQPLELGAQWIHGKEGNPLWEYVNRKGIAVHPAANPDGEGIFYRTSDGARMPVDVKEETEKVLDGIHDDLDKFHRRKDEFAEEDVPESVGQYFEDEFNKWLEEEKIGKESEERITWRKAFFDWYIRWEECDAGCDNLFRQSALSWGEYIDYADDTSFSDGYQSFVDSVVADGKKNTNIYLGHEVRNLVAMPNYDKVLIRCENHAAFIARHVIVTISLGCLKDCHKSLFYPSLPKRTIQAIENIDFGTIDRIKLDFEECFWDPPGIHILWDDDMRDQKSILAEPVTKENWTRHVVGFDVVIKQPNMLMAWVSGRPARFMETLSDEEIGSDLCKLLKKVQPSVKLPPLRAVVVTRWFTNPFQRGVYSYRSPEADKQVPKDPFKYKSI